MVFEKTLHGIVIKKFDPSETDQVVNFLIEEFIRDEPLGKSLQLGASPDVEKFIRDALKFDASFVAIDTEADNTLVGVRLNGIIRKGDTHEATDDIIIKFVDDAFDRVDVFNKYKIDVLLDGRMLGVHKDYRGRGIARRMMEATLDFMRENKIPLCYIPCTSAFTVKVLKKLDFETVLVLPYDEYLVDGKQVFFPEEPHTEFIACIKLV